MKEEICTSTLWSWCLMFQITTYNRLSGCFHAVNENNNSLVINVRHTSVVSKLTRVIIVISWHCNVQIMFVMFYNVHVYFMVSLHMKLCSNSNSHSCHGERWHYMWRISDVSMMQMQWSLLSLSATDSLASNDSDTSVNACTAQTVLRSVDHWKSSIMQLASTLVVLQVVYWHS